MRIRVLRESKESMKKSLKVFKTYALSKGVKELPDLNSEDGTTLSKANMFYFKTDDIESLIAGFKKDKKKDIVRNSSKLPGDKFRAWDSYGTVTIASLQVDNNFTKALKKMKPSGVSTFEPSGEFSF